MDPHQLRQGLEDICESHQQCIDLKGHYEMIYNKCVMRTIVSKVFFCGKKTRYEGTGARVGERVLTESGGWARRGDKSQDWD